ncbi:rab-GTPase-TBC domain-containing protein [Thamnocephalis sphaerospora]|uniref:GTPase-activating protein GYP7 n=1 Tax=Thamnocephalis sphaerospora TaxID=78915 RepID=A0A4P9XNX5_9FUNG|nr:rab-GTPase-TBC domain-containing protein [Thamnocephalis sphaerospora]|eukprot:RKP07674.1 rab-GTPase-TBC domain-containing protein [Thamnocephalis sphaerospora]
MSGRSDGDRSPSQRSLSSSRGDGEQVQLLHCKSNVYVHCPPDGKNQQRGYLAVFEKVDVQYLAWIPDAAIPSEELDAYVRVDASVDDPLNASMVNTVLLPLWSDAELHRGGGEHNVAEAGVCAPLGTLRTLLVHPPSLTQWYGSVVLSLRDGTSWPPLWFHDDENRSAMEASDGAHWGGDDLIVWLQRIADIVRSTTNVNLFAVNPNAEDYLELRLQSPDSTDDEAIAQEKEARRTSYAAATTETTMATVSALQRGPRSRLSSIDALAADPTISTLKELKWNMLERFAQVTRLSRSVAASVLEHPISRPIVALLPQSIASLAEESQVRQVCDDYSPAALYLAKWAADAIKRQHYLPGEKEQSAAGAGVEMATMREEKTELGIFEVLSAYEDMPNFTTRRLKPVTPEQWFAWQDEQGRFTVSAEDICAAVYAGSIEPDIRPAIWPFLLHVFPWNSTAAERESILEAKRAEYEALKQQWQAPEARATAEYIEQEHRIEKDVLRTDRTIPEYADQTQSSHNTKKSTARSASVRERGLPGGNPNLAIMQSVLMTYNYYNVGHGYVQGMSDLVSPLFFVLRDEVLTFWCFVGFMERMERNFSVDQVGMRNQLVALEQLIEFMFPRLHRHLERADSLNLFFCFRWVLIWFKREFKFAEVMRLWEVLWTDRFSREFHLFIALAILDLHQTVIMEHLMQFDGILKYVNDLSMTMDLDEVICRAEFLYLKFRHAVHVLDEQSAAIQAHQATSSDGEAEAVDVVVMPSKDGSLEEDSNDEDDEDNAMSIHLRYPVTPALRALLTDEKSDKGHDVCLAAPGTKVE